MSATEITLAPLPQLTPPDGWELRRLKYVSDVQVSNVDKKSVEGEQPVRLCNYVDVYKNDVITPEMEFMEATATDAQIENFALKKGDVLITKDSETWDDIAVPAVVSEDMPNVVCGYHLAHIRPKTGKLDGRYLARCFAARGIADQFFLSANGITRFGLGKDEITGGWFPIPPLKTQQRIADYLDRETARIDALIAAKERLLELLAEKRRALITHAVTRGVNPAAPLRDSGLPWLGMIPTYWKVERLKFHMPRIEQGWSPQCDNFPANDNEWGVLKVGAVNGWEFNPSENKRLPSDLQPLVECEIHDGDVLMSRANTTQLLGRAALVRKVRPKLIFCDKHYRLTLNPDTMNSAFLVFYLRSTAGHFEFERDATGASNSMQNIGQDSVQNVWVAVPPLPDQADIVRYVTETSGSIDTMEMANQRTVDLLRERRLALITAAVTGQLLVKG